MTCHARTHARHGLCTTAHNRPHVAVAAVAGCFDFSDVPSVAHCNVCEDGAAQEDCTEATCAPGLAWYNSNGDHTCAGEWCWFQSYRPTYARARQTMHNMHSALSVFHTNAIPILPFWLPPFTFATSNVTHAQMHATTLWSSRRGRRHMWTATTAITKAITTARGSA